MKKTILFLAIILTIISCNKFEDFSTQLENPNDLVLGKHILLIDGEMQEEWTPSIKYRSEGNMHITFSKEIPEIEGGMLIEISNIDPIDETQFGLSGSKNESLDDSKVVMVSILQIKDFDLRGQNYEYEASTGDGFELFYFNEEDDEVAAKLLAKFRRIERNRISSKESGVDKFITVEIVFKDKFSR